MAITLNTKSYVLDSQPSPDSAKYAGPAATFDKKDFLLISRTAPKRTATSQGVARARAVTKRTFVVDGVYHDVIFNTEMSVPVGVASTDVDAVRDDHGDFIISTACQDLVNKHDLQN